MAAPTQHTVQTYKESHWAPERHQKITELCAATAGTTPAVRSLAHYSNGILDFVICRSDRAPMSAASADPGTPEQDEALPGSRLLLCAQDLDARLRPLGTGELVRTVVAGPGGGLWGGRVKPGEYLAAVADTSDDVAALDEAMNRLVTRIRGTVHNLPTEAPGGDESARADDGAPCPGLRVDLGTGAGQDGPYGQRLRSLLGTHLSVAGLQYAAYYRDLRLVCVGDVFDDDDMGPRFIDVSVRARRTAYRELTGTLRGHLPRLADALGMVAPPGNHRPPMNRLVLDVQEGAVCFEWPSPRDLVIGVTLNQLQVGGAEKTLDRLARELHLISVPPQR
ncbi:hypothetical protein GTW43_01220 [Streptomyces sp. SID5785]|uniref:hypothetical protein n=1 Tax=Streptomyces sp. SID5785 TaxID=2690309 RepID=UPI001361B3DD|nr:hypothetical protein [Streptomyces sp. SID5785]MZD03708.1 hypothetical protein [Streptomyces sp. SID5785]